MSRNEIYDLNNVTINYLHCEFMGKVVFNAIALTCKYHFASFHLKFCALILTSNFLTFSYLENDKFEIGDFPHIIKIESYNQGGKNT